MILIALGSNLPFADMEPPLLLAASLRHLERRGDIKILTCSRLWNSQAWPPSLAAAGQGKYWNAVAALDTVLSPEALLDRLHETEENFGRRRAHEVRWAARSLDLDLLDYDGRVMAGRPTLPHPRMAERLFVLKPLAEIAPDWRPSPDGPPLALLIERLEGAGQILEPAPLPDQRIFQNP